MLNIDKLIEHCKQEAMNIPKDWDGTYPMLLNHMAEYRTVAFRLLLLKKVMGGYYNDDYNVFNSSSYYYNISSVQSAIRKRY